MEVELLSSSPAKLLPIVLPLASEVGAKALALANANATRNKTFIGDGHILALRTELSKWGLVIKYETTVAGGAVGCESNDGQKNQREHEIQFNSIQPAPQKRAGSCTRSSIAGRANQVSSFLLLQIVVRTPNGQFGTYRIWFSDVIDAANLHSQPGPMLPQTQSHQNSNFEHHV